MVFSSLSSQQNTTKGLKQNSRLMNEQSKVILECAGITLTMGGVFLKM